MKARIENSDDGMWLIIGDAEISYGSAWSITPEEVEPIMLACQKYMNENQKDQ